MKVAADSTVAVTYYDFRFNDSGTDLEADHFIVHRHPGPDRRARANPKNREGEIRLTNTSFDMRQTVNGVTGFFVGDYVGLAVGQQFRLDASWGDP